MRVRGRTGALTALTVLAGVLASSCGTSAGNAARARSTVRGRRRIDDGASHLGRPGNPVGTTLTVPAAGTTLLVTLTGLIDPLRDSGARLPAGMHAAGVLVSARNAGPGSYDSSATSDFSLSSAAGRASPVYVPTGQCKTYLQSFMNEIGPGQARTGCVAFAVPTRQLPNAVSFSPDGGTDGVSRSWAVR